MLNTAGSKDFKIPDRPRLSTLHMKVSHAEPTCFSSLGLIVKLWRKLSELTKQQPPGPKNEGSAEVPKTAVPQIAT